MTRANRPESGKLPEPRSPRDGDLRDGLAGIFEVLKRAWDAVRERIAEINPRPVPVPVPVRRSPVRGR